MCIPQVQSNREEGNVHHQKIKALTDHRQFGDFGHLPPEVAHGHGVESKCWQDEVDTGQDHNDFVEVHDLEVV